MKRGISSLVSMVLLVGLTVGIIVIITTWGITITEETTQFSEGILSQWERGKNVKFDVQEAIITGSPLRGQGGTGGAKRSGGVIEASSFDQEQDPPKNVKYATITVINQADVVIDGFKVILHYKDRDQKVIAEKIATQLNFFGSGKLQFSFVEEKERDYLELIPIVQEREVQERSLKITPQEIV